MAAMMSVFMVMMFASIFTSITLGLEVSLLLLQLLFLVFLVLVFQGICADRANHGTKYGPEDPATELMPDETTCTTANQGRAEPSFSIWARCALLAWLALLVRWLTLRRIGLLT
jgi:hypothetical protein